MNANATQNGNSLPNTNTIKDGVLRYPPTSINVVIVGGGIAGLFAAIECWRKGHEVQVLEKAGSLSEAGDVVGIGPSAWVTIHNYPAMLEEWNQVAYRPLWHFYGADGKFMCPPAEYEYNRPGVAQHAAFPLVAKPVMIRFELASMLADQCKRLGIPIIFDTGIVDYEENDLQATAISSDGRRFTGDVVVAADGVGTRSHRVVLGHDVRAVSTNAAIYRLMCPTPLLKDAPAFQEMYKKIPVPVMRMVVHSEDFFYAQAVTPKYTTLNLGVEDDASATESWTTTIDAEAIMSLYPNLEKSDPVVAEVLRHTPSHKITRTLLVMRDPQQKWTSSGGRIVQIGDAAHSFLPTSGSGACVAIEDALSLPECLRLGTRDGIAIGTRVHELLRRQRTSIIQRVGINNRISVGQGTPADILHYGKWNWTHNAEKYATERFQEARKSMEKGTPFENTNLPPGYVWEDWSVLGDLESAKNGSLRDLKRNGDWSIE